jgi:hypothetical protein
MRGANDFLRQFLEMRKQIAPNPSAAAAVAKQEPMSKRTKKGSDVRQVLDGSISHIIENTPPKKEVMEYFQDLCNRLTAEKMV